MLGGSRDLNESAMQQSCGDLLQIKDEKVVDKKKN